METELKKRLDAVMEKIRAACNKAGRDPSEVKLVAVSKTKPAELVKAGIDCGIKILGENYVQEAIEKIETIGRETAQWHFIGRLQTKKAKYVARLFDLVHSVDNVKLANELDKRAGIEGRVLPVLVQVNISGEETKGGAAEDEAKQLVDIVAGLPNLDLKGLMTMPPFFDDPDRARPYFAALRELRDKIGGPRGELSMGMSGDFEAAIAEGSTLVRVGTAIFGARDYGAAG